MFYATKFCNFTSNLSYFMKEKNQLVNSKKLSNIIAKSMKDKKAKEVWSPEKINERAAQIANDFIDSINTHQSR